MCRKLFLLVSLVLMLALALPTQANLLLNPGFEDGDWQSEESVPDNWWKWSGNWGWASWKNNADEAHSGSKFVAVGGWENGQYAIYGQNLDSSPGVAYTFSAWAKTEDWGAPTGEMRIEFKDAVGDNIRMDTLVLFAGEQSDTWTQYDLVADPAPAGTVTAQFLLYGEESGTVQFDDASVVPEPATIALLGLGGLALLRRRR